MGLSFFGESTVTVTSYLATPEQRFFPQLEEDEPENSIFQQDVALPHWHDELHDGLNVTVPDLTPCDLFLWGFIKYCVFVPPLPADLRELKKTGLKQLLIQSLKTHLSTFGKKSTIDFFKGPNGLQKG